MGEFQIHADPFEVPDCLGRLLLRAFRNVSHPRRNVCHKRPASHVCPVVEQWRRPACIPYWHPWPCRGVVAGDKATTFSTWVSCISCLRVCSSVLLSPYPGLRVIGFVGRSCRHVLFLSVAERHGVFCALTTQSRADGSEAQCHLPYRSGPPLISDVSCKKTCVSIN